MGTLHCEVIYVPFKGARVHSSAQKAEDDSEDYESHDKNEASKAKASLKSLTQITDDDKGILTVTLTGCSNLQVTKCLRNSSYDLTYCSSKLLKARRGELGALYSIADVQIIFLEKYKL